MVLRAVHATGEEGVTRETSATFHALSTLPLPPVTRDGPGGPPYFPGSFLIPLIVHPPQECCLAESPYGLVRGIAKGFAVLENLHVAGKPAGDIVPFVIGS